MRSIIVFGSLLAFILFQSCTATKPAVYTEPTIGAASFDYWIHSPMHPQSRQAIQFKTAVADNKGIIKAELYIYEYELYTNEKGQPSKRRKSNSQWGLVNTWQYERPTTEAVLTFDFIEGFSDFSNVEYIFKVYDVEGAASERLALFDAGKSPWGDEKILLYATNKKPLKESINLCFLPDTDYNQNRTDFLKDVESLIYDGYHANNKINANKDLWQFYYTQHEVDGNALTNNFRDVSLYPDFLKNSLIQGIDAFGLLHQLPYGDGAYLQRNLRFLAYNFFTSETYNHGTAVHETAHAVFNLSDEYDLCACFEHPDGANVFNSLKGCQKFNVANNFPKEECTIIEHLNGKDWYMSEKDVYFKTREACEAYNVDNGYGKNTCERFIDVDQTNWYRSLEGLCIMQDDGDEEIRDFKRTCSSIIDRYYTKLRGDAGGFMANQEEMQENIFGYEAVVLMELQTHQSQVAFEVKETIQGVPNKNLTTRAALQLEFSDTNGQPKHSVSFAAPNEVFLHGETSEELIELPDVTYRFAVPYEKGATYKIVKKEE